MTTRGDVRRSNGLIRTVDVRTIIRRHERSKSIVIEYTSYFNDNQRITNEMGVVQFMAQYAWPSERKDTMEFVRVRENVLRLIFIGMTWFSSRRRETMCAHGTSADISFLSCFVLLTVSTISLDFSVRLGWRRKTNSIHTRIQVEGNKNVSCFTTLLLSASLTRVSRTLPRKWMRQTFHLDPTCDTSNRPGSTLLWIDDVFEWKLVILARACQQLMQNHGTETA